MLLFPKKITIAEPGNLYRGSEYDLAKEGLNLAINPVIIDVIGSDTEVPDQKITTGEEIQATAVLKNGVITPEDRSNIDRIDILEKRDLNFKVLDSAGNHKHFFISNMDVLQKWDFAFSGGEAEYMPIELVGTHESVLNIHTVENLEGYDIDFVPAEFDLEDENGNSIEIFI